jgi:RNA polymerase sigma-70 factor (sigma-E family)
MVETFDDFMGAELPGLLRFAAVLTGERHLAEDVVQEVMIRAHKRWNAISVLDQPVTYVRRMVVNEYISWRRKWARIIPRSEIEDDRHLPDPATGHAERAELPDRLRKLPRRQRTVIVLRYYGGLSDRDIGDTLGCTTGTVRSHASRALNSLRIDMGEVPDAPSMSAVRKEL